MPVPRPNVQRVAANPANYTPGRSRPISRITFHHIVGDGPSAVSRFLQAGSGVSSNYVIASDGTITQTVPDSDTAWADGNWESNCRSISIEHAGGHANVPYTAAMYDASERLVAWLIQTYGISDFKRHREVSSRPTACPGDLNMEGIITKARLLIEASNRPAVVAPPPPPPPPQANPIKNFERLPELRIVEFNKDTNLWGLNALKWADFKPVGSFKKGDKFEAIGIAHHILGGKYYMRSSDFGQAEVSGKAVFNVGVNLVDADPYVPPADKPAAAPAQAPAAAAPAQAPQPVKPAAAAQPAPAAPQPAVVAAPPSGGSGAAPAAPQPAVAAPAAQPAANIVPIKERKPINWGVIITDVVGLITAFTGLVSAILGFYDQAAYAVSTLAGYYFGKRSSGNPYQKKK